MLELCVCGFCLGSNRFGVRWPLLRVYQGGGVVMLGVVCDCGLGIGYLSYL